MPTPTDVLFIWEVREELRRYFCESLSDLPDVNLIFPDDINDQTLLKHAVDTDITVGWRPSDALLKTAEKLSIHIHPGAGVQHLIEPFRKLNNYKSVALINGHGNAYFTAQHAVGLLFTLTNKLIPHHNWMVEGKWRTGDGEGKNIPLRNRDIGLLGYGAVNRLVHRFLSGFDVKFSVLKRSWNELEGVTYTIDGRYTPDELNRFLENVDILMVAIPATDQTDGLIGADELELLGQNGLIVNVARGLVVEEKSLYSALKEQKIAGAAIDVWYDYSPEEDIDGRKYPYSYPFYQLDNVVLSPHRAASPFDDLRRWDEVIENIRRFAAGRDDYLNSVDLERGY